jgi:hypothetical protein
MQFDHCYFNLPQHRRTNSAQPKTSTFFTSTTSQNCIEVKQKMVSAQPNTNQTTTQNQIANPNNNKKNLHPKTSQPHKRKLKSKYNTT